MNLKRLSDPFHYKDLDFRIQSSGLKNGKPWGMILCYVDARAVMDRLDQTLGPANWKDSYDISNDSKGEPLGMVCHLSVKIGGEWVTKVDGSPVTAIESFKGGFSKALVRAAVKWGVGRYLYAAPLAFAEFISQKTSDSKSAKIENHWFQWRVPDNVAKYYEGLAQKCGEETNKRAQELRKELRQEREDPNPRPRNHAPQTQAEAVKRAMNTVAKSEMTPVLEQFEKAREGLRN